MHAISNENEIWKDVAGFEGLYQVSNFGNVRSVTRLITRSDGKTYLKKGKQLKSFLTLPVVETKGFSVLRGLPSRTNIVL